MELQYLCDMYLYNQKNRSDKNNKTTFLQTRNNYNSPVVDWISLITELPK